jgi:diguanylate cyclase
MRKFVYLRPYIILTTFILTLVILAIIFHSESIKITIQHPESLNTAWSYDSQPLAQLPQKIQMDTPQPYTITRTLGDDFSTRQVLMIRTSLSDITIRLDGNIVYEKTFEAGKLPPYASMWHFVELPGHSNQKELSITFYSPYQGISGTINTIYYGSHASLYQYQFQTYGIRLIIGGFVFIVGVLIMLVSLLAQSTSKKGFVSVGLFAILLSLWIIAESRLLQWITGSQLIIGSLAYLVLPLFPIPMAFYLKNHVVRRYKKPFDLLIGVYFVHFMVILCMQLFGIYDFFETVDFSIILLTIGIITAVAILIMEIKKEDNKEAKLFIKMFVFLIVFGFLEFINILMNNYMYTSTFLLIGIAILMLIMLINYGNFMISRYKMSYEKEVYEKLAYQDQLTGAKNRLAYEDDFERFFNQTHQEASLTLIYFDFDDLKAINDIYGHLEGDEVLKKGYQIIEDAFGGKGYCYRIGGDEFACLLTQLSKHALDEKIKDFETQIDQLSQSLKRAFRVSYGYTLNKKTDLKPSDMVKRADDHMYINKCNHKGNCARVTQVKI